MMGLVHLLLDGGPLLGVLLVEVGYVHVPVVVHLFLLVPGVLVGAVPGVVRPPASACRRMRASTGTGIVLGVALDGRVVDRLVLSDLLQLACGDWLGSVEET